MTTMQATVYLKLHQKAVDALEAVVRQHENRCMCTFCRAWLHTTQELEEIRHPGMHMILGLPRD